MTLSDEDQRALQDSKSTTLRELGLFIVKSAFALNSAAAIALIPLLGAALMADSDRKITIAILNGISNAGYWFIFGAILSLGVAIISHYQLMKSWIENKKPEGNPSKRARVASWSVLLFALPSIPFMIGIYVVLSTLRNLF